MFVTRDRAIGSPGLTAELTANLDLDQPTGIRVKPIEHPIMIVEDDQGTGSGFPVDAGEIFEMSTTGEPIYATHVGPSGGVTIYIMAWTE